MKPLLEFKICDSWVQWTYGPLAIAVFRGRIHYDLGSIERLLGGDPSIICGKKIKRVQADGQEHQHRLLYSKDPLASVDILTHSSEGDVLIYFPTSPRIRSLINRIQGTNGFELFDHEGLKEKYDQLAQITIDECYEPISQLESPVSISFSLAYWPAFLIKGMGMSKEEVSKYT